MLIFIISCSYNNTKTIFLNLKNINLSFSSSVGTYYYISKFDHRNLQTYFNNKNKCLINAYNFIDIKLNSNLIIRF